MAQQSSWKIKAIMLRNHCFSVLSIFFLMYNTSRVESVEDDIDWKVASCWDSNCSIVCEQALESDLKLFIGEYAMKNPKCASTGLTLSLNEIDFQNEILNFDWLPLNSKVLNLTLKFVNHKKSLVVQRDTIDPVSFDNLQYLKIHQHEGTSLSADLVENKKFPNLETLIVHGYFKESIQEITFQGLSRIMVLSLTSCRIERIAPMTFDRLLSTLEYLDLSNNLLKTIPAGLFIKFPLRHINVHISNNPWHCNCALQEFKDLLQFEWFNGTVECVSPFCMKGIDVELANFCDAGKDVVCPTTEVSMRQMVDERGPITKECYDDLTKTCEEVQVKGQTKIRSLSYEMNGEIQIDIDNEYQPSSLVVIWFETIKTSDANNEYYESSETVSCQSSETDSFRIRNLSPDTAYTVCVVSKTETTISPLDCFPYYNQTVVDTIDEDIWILEEDKVKVISFVVCGAIASLLFGLAMSFVLIRKNPAWLRGNDRVVRMSKDPNSDVMIMPPEWSRQTAGGISSDLKQRRFSDISIISGKSYVITANSANELFKRKLMEKRLSENTDEIENKYYLDYLPHKIPPPLPPPNMAPLSRNKSTSDGKGDTSQAENYYSDLSFKNQLPM